MYIPMGLTAENVAEQFDVSREDMDRFAQRSQERAVAAQASGFFARELTPYTKADGTVVAADDGPRADSTLEKLASLEPVFKPGGKVTAGNACPLNDGAAAVVVMSDAKAAELGVAAAGADHRLGRVRASRPEIMGVGPIEAVRERARPQAGMTIDDIDVDGAERGVRRAGAAGRAASSAIDPFGEKLNPHGGAIALGHPFGMTGARIMSTLLNDLETLDGTIGLETMCVGGGQGMAMIVERLELAPPARGADSPAAMPATMAALEDPAPISTGISLWMITSSSSRGQPIGSEGTDTRGRGLRPR